MIAFFSILYNPTINALKNVINAKKYGITPIVYLNNVSDEYLIILRKLDVIIMGSNINVGLGIPFYEVENFLNENSFKYYVYFDQDTIVKNHVWLKIKNTYKRDFNEKNIGMLFYGHAKSNSPIVVNSGSLFSIRVLNKIGFHDKRYFVEGVDYEFCLRLKNNGYVIKKIYESGIDHYSLQDNEIVKIFSKNIKIRSYGYKRLSDFFISHCKLILKAIILGEFILAIIFFKSLVIFFLEEFLSKLIKKFT